MTVSLRPLSQSVATKAAFTVVAITIAFSCGAQSRSPERKGQSWDAKHGQAIDVRGSKESPLIVETIKTPKSAEELAHEHYESHEKPVLDRWLTGATIALAVITLGLAIFTAFLWLATRKLVLGAEDTAKRQLRAYVFVRPELPIDIPMLNQWHNRGMKFMIYNTGQTPAYDLRLVTQVAFRERTIDAVLPAITWGEGSRLMLGPGMHSEQVMKMNGPLSPNHIAAFHAGTHAIYVWGEVRYQDAFQTPRWTKFAFLIAGEGRISGNVHACAQGNEAS